jgi:actin-related protein 5
LKRQKKNPEETKLYTNRIKRANEDDESEPDVEDHIIQRPYVPEQMPGPEELERR